ncbi:DUF4279 domain-containing protein [Nocardioides zeae]|uniref:DUF4279 domain-containing protein n=1 Tax=Nocardioides imazamoxiresistens TaxID=3231893 RepID=A0ABU3PX10_9ACTN|nr:DUF4279 domain-containing protein [Nocardioides zeae]MDT9593734.1 DUF4279 domain-containing protein [Nocardioides zeae]
MTQPSPRMKAFEELPSFGLEMEPFRAYLLVWSRALRLSEITRSIGIEPSESHDIGDPNPYYESGNYRYASWKWDLDDDRRISPGTEELSEAIEELSDDLADRLKELVNRGCFVELRIVQVFEGDVELDDPGIHLTAAAIRWVARAGALIDVDQYVPGGDDEEGNTEV